jgi:hypothetical protein
MGQTDCREQERKWREQLRGCVQFARQDTMVAWTKIHILEKRRDWFKMFSRDMFSRIWELSLGKGGEEGR